MATRRQILLASCVTVIAVGTAYLGYLAWARQGAGDQALAQAPMNASTAISPAFIMAVDDSNSMTFERLFDGGDGRLQWDSTNKTFFKKNGGYYDVGAGCAYNSADCYLYLFPHASYNSSYSPGKAIPPLPEFGFARSPAYNKSYFNPELKYDPWLNANGEPWPDATPSKVRADPRDSAYGSSFTAANSVVYDLTGNRADSTETFQLLKGMAIPNLSGTGMKYYSNGWKTDKLTLSADTLLSFDYFPATYYLPEAQAAPKGYRTANRYRPIIENACGPDCDLRKYEIKPENYGNTAAYNREMQNFANWFQYHRNRLLAMAGAMTHALSDPRNIDIGYFTINDRVNVSMFDMNLPSEKSKLYTRILELQAGGLVKKGGGTPNRSAVEHLAKQFRRTDAGAPVQLSCQKNAGMLFTDGYSNSGDVISTSVGNADGSLGSPFSDGISNTIADIAASYYSGSNTPLRSGAGFGRGEVNVPKQCTELSPGSNDWKRLDCQSDLHMNFYAITLGAKGKIYEVDTAATADPYGSPPIWSSTDPATVNDGTVIDELWHATINGRGEFINSKTPADLTTAIRHIVASVVKGGSPSGSIAASGTRIGNGSLSVLPAYITHNDGNDWNGTLTGSRIVVDRYTGVVDSIQSWEAGNLLDTRTDPATRRIVAGKVDASSTPGSFSLVDFNASQLTVADLCSDGLCTVKSELEKRFCPTGGTGTPGCATAGTAIDYLRGDRRFEADGTLRGRSSILGDIVNSTPVISQPGDDYGFRGLRDASGNFDGFDYASYLRSKKERPPMIYVGANDGMLHAFDGQTGHERFAYIPSTALGHMGNLLIPYDPIKKTGRPFEHTYFVDGPLTVSDARTDGGWRTVLVGSSGAGGRSVFAIDISTPETLDAGDLLWEINAQGSHSASGDSSINAAASRNGLGHVLGKPFVVPVMTEQGVAWKAVFGNGYGSRDGRAALYAIDIASGATHVAAAEENPLAGLAGGNGLGNVVVLDLYKGTTAVRGRDGYADTVYGADQNGSIWKFDLRSNNIAAPTQPFFTATDAAGNRQSITGGLTATLSPSGDIALFFGSGSYSFHGDASDFGVQTLYGLFDRLNGSTVSGGRAQLLQKKLVAKSIDGSREVSTGTLGPGDRGWFLDLQVDGLDPAGERFVGTPAISDSVVFFPTYQPNTASNCGRSGANRLYGLFAFNGGGAFNQVRIGSPNAAQQTGQVGAIPLDIDGNAPVKSVAVLSTGRPSPLSEDDKPTPQQLNSLLSRQCMTIIQASGAPPLYLPRPCGRQSWRQIR